MNNNRRPGCPRSEPTHASSSIMLVNDCEIAATELTPKSPCSGRVTGAPLPIQLPYCGAPQLEFRGKWSGRAEKPSVNTIPLRINAVGQCADNMGDCGALGLSCA